jgi:hypothetical protein
LSSTFFAQSEKNFSETFGSRQKLLARARWRAAEMIYQI